MANIGASVTLHVEIFDAQAMWDHALTDYQENHFGCDEKAEEEFVGMCGTRDNPDLGECLRMIFDPGESPPGISIQDSAASVEGSI